MKKDHKNERIVNFKILNVNVMKNTQTHKQTKNQVYCDPSKYSYTTRNFIDIDVIFLVCKAYN